MDGCSGWLWATSAADLYISSRTGNFKLHDVFSISFLPSGTATNVLLSLAETERNPHIFGIRPQCSS